jgi:hypothetical protein
VTYEMRLPEAPVNGKVNPRTLYVLQPDPAQPASAVAAT